MIESNGQHFCCDGCKLVHELLAEHQLCSYYEFTEHPGLKPAAPAHSHRFGWLDDALAAQQLISFSEGDSSVVSFHIPQIHCTSCIWLLENLRRLDPGISGSSVNFLEKKVTVSFQNKKTSLRKIVEVLHRTGYGPDLHLKDLKRSAAQKTNRSLISKIVLAGFCFGNIMMLSFPEYLSGVSSIELPLKQFFGYLIWLLALPVFFYSAGHYFLNSWKAVRVNYFSIDLPIALGLSAMMLRSTYEIFSGTGAGYLDSMAGLVFFLLIGKFLQSVTYRSLSFERDYESFFPAAVTVKRKGEEISLPLSQLQAGEKIVIHSGELVPADALLLTGAAQVDYSFVTGESAPVNKAPGDVIFAGGKQEGSAIELQVLKSVDQSYLTQLWNHESFRKKKGTEVSRLADTISKYFTWAILGIAALTAAYWIRTDVERALLASTSILIIACPCALAITVPFTFGNILRYLERHRFFLRNAATVETLARIDTLVFDKTGTITRQQLKGMEWEGKKLSAEQQQMIRSLTSHSIHPKSKIITRFFPGAGQLDVKNFREIAGKGIAGEINGILVRVGAWDFVKNAGESFRREESVIYVSFGDEVAGRFMSHELLRPGMNEQLDRLQPDFDLYLLTGDHGFSRQPLQKTFGAGGHLQMSQSPYQKLEFIRELQSKGKQVMMLGDGLNDAGALKQSDFGVAVTDDLFQFSPASDAILHGDELPQLNRLLRFCKSGLSIIWFVFFFSLVYNVAGLWFAVQGNLSPLVAAILMPLSSISVIVISTLAVKWQARSLRRVKPFEHQRKAVGEFT
jgi:Cu+-exporting ATPase